MSGGETVLVTGGSGYIGGWCVAGLLQQGYVVRTTVRDLSKEAAVRASLAKITDPGNRLSFHVANLTGLFDKDLGSVAPGLGHKHDFSSEKAQRMLGWKPRPLEETILDCANSLIATGAV